MNPRKKPNRTKQQSRRNRTRCPKQKQVDAQVSDQPKTLDPNDPNVIEACVIEWIKEIRRFFGEEDKS